MNRALLSILLILATLSSAPGACADNPCQRLLLGGDNFIGPHRVLSFTNAKDVAKVLGDTGLRNNRASVRLARDFFPTHPTASPIPQCFR
jgi:hypothetical protein